MPIATPERVRIEILAIADCPHASLAEDHVRQALRRARLDDTEVTLRIVSTEEEAAALPFAGSPTVLIDGTDPFPSAGPTSQLACRLYPTSSGLVGVPPVEQLLEALNGRPERETVTPG